MKSPHRITALYLLKLVNDIFTRIFGWIMHLLPLGLCCLIASNVAVFDNQTFDIVSMLALVVGIAALIILLFSTLLMRLLLKTPFLTIIKIFSRPLLLALLVDNDTVAIPSAMQILNKQQINREIVHLIFPLGIVVNRLGEVLLLAMVATFIAKFYNIPLGWYQIVLIWLFSAFSGAMISGRLMVLASIFISLAGLVGMPITTGVLILALLDPFLNRLIEAVNVYSNCAAVILIARCPYKIEQAERADLLK